MSYCPTCLLCETHCQCGATVWDTSNSRLRLADVVGQRTNMTYDTGPLAVDRAQLALEAAIKELVAMRLHRIRGYALNTGNHAFLVRLVPGAWIQNAAMSKERREVLDLMLTELADKIVPVLDRHLPGKRWHGEWTPDPDAASDESTATMLAFRWED